MDDNIVEQRYAAQFVSAASAEAWSSLMRMVWRLRPVVVAISPTPVDRSSMLNAVENWSCVKLGLRPRYFVSASFALARATLASLIASASLRRCCRILIRRNDRDLVSKHATDIIQYPSGHSNVVDVLEQAPPGKRLVHLSPLYPRLALGRVRIVRRIGQRFAPERGINFK